MFFSMSDSLRSDSSLSVLYSDIFFFPFSLCVNHLLDFWDCTAESLVRIGSYLTGYSDQADKKAKEVDADTKEPMG